MEVPLMPSVMSKTNVGDPLQMVDLRGLIEPPTMPSVAPKDGVSDALQWVNLRSLMETPAMPSLAANQGVSDTPYSMPSPTPNQGVSDAPHTMNDPFLMGNIVGFTAPSQQANTPQNTGNPLYQGFPGFTTAPTIAHKQDISPHEPPVPSSVRDGGKLIPTSGEHNLVKPPSMPSLANQKAAGDTPHPATDSLPLDEFPESSNIPFSAPHSENASGFYFLREETTASEPSSAFNVYTVRQDFPILHQTIHGKPLIWLDNAATTQKPQSVIDTLSQYYQHYNSNVHRGAHTLASLATEGYENARKKVQKFLGAGSPEEIIFVRGTTEAINLVAQTYGRKHVKQGDEIVLTTLEHHANIVPWQMLCQEKGSTLRVVPITDSGEIILEEYAKLLGPQTRIVAITHVSNVLGTVLPVREMAAMAHYHGATVVVDGAQSVSHFRVNVHELDSDFYVFSGHKLFAPTGIGVVYGKKAMLEEMPPWQGGGAMIDKVTFEKTTYSKPPTKFEAGTGNIADAIGLGAALDYLERIGHEAMAQYEQMLMSYAIEALSTIPGLRHYGTAPGKVGVLAFNIPGIRPEDMAKYLDSEGIAARAGHHCAQPTMERFGVTGMVRPSIAFYNTIEEIDVLVNAIRKVIQRM
jgi:SufS family cysteine desulfurase